MDDCADPRADLGGQMSSDDVRSVPRDRDGDDRMSSSIAAIDARIEELEAALAPTGFGRESVADRARAGKQPSSG